MSHANDSYNSGGYVAFRDGIVEEYDLVHWEGLGRRFASGSVTDPSDSENSAFVQGVAKLGVGLQIEWIDDVFELFYEGPSAASSFVVYEDGVLVIPPRLKPRRT